MCKIERNCPMYEEYCRTGNMSVMCKSCVHLKRAEKKIVYARTGLAVAALAFIVSTYILF